jgi:hypothetical protein
MLPAIHRRLAYVPSEANLWPSLTGAEALRFLGEIHGSVDTAFRTELVDRFELTLDKKVRGLQPWQPPEGLVDRGVCEPSGPHAARRTDHRPRPAHGAGLS